MKPDRKEEYGPRCGDCDHLVYPTHAGGVCGYLGSERRLDYTRRKVGEGVDSAPWTDLSECGCLSQPNAPKLKKSETVRAATLASALRYITSA